MRRAARVDANHKQIVQGLRSSGCTVQDLSAVGKGCPDILVGRNGLNILIEIKTKKGKLTSRQVEWHQAWRGNAIVVTSIEEAIHAINELFETRKLQ